MTDKKFTINLEFSEIFTTNMLLAYIESHLNKKRVSSEDMQIIRDNFRRTAKLADEYKKLIKLKKVNRNLQQHGEQQNGKKMAFK